MKIYYPKSNNNNNNVEHKYTIILLHSLYYDHASFKPLIEKIKNLSPYIKIIAPNAPKRDIDWPEGKELGISSWYNYFTSRDGELQHDDIDETQYFEQCNRISNIIEREAKTIERKNIILIGESQGGTLVGGLSVFHNNIGEYILLDSVFMDNIIKSTIDNTIQEINNRNIAIYSSELDEIYTLRLQQESIDRLNIRDRIKVWFIEKGSPHSTLGQNRDRFVLDQIREIFSIE